MMNKKLMDEKRFDVRFDPDAVKEYNKLDNSVIDTVNKAIDELEICADEIGKPLSNNNYSKLTGCKEIKLRGFNLRIVFRITNKVVEVLRIVYILAIEERSDDIVFKRVHQRNRELGNLTEDMMKKKLMNSTKWKNKKDAK